MLITPCLKEVKTTVVYPWFATTKQGGHVAVDTIEFFLTEFT